VTRSVYIIGGAGSGKSTFTQALLDCSNRSMNPLEDLHKTPNARGTIVTLRGHRVGLDGLYLGCMRDEYPGTDGLDRASSITGEEWLEQGKHREFDWILSEGATLATRRFLGALAKHTELMLVHLVVEDFIRDLRFMRRGSTQNEQFVQNTVTRSANLFRDIECQRAEFNTGEPGEWDDALEICLSWLDIPNI